MVFVATLFGLFLPAFYIFHPSLVVEQNFNVHIKAEMALEI
jgi:hypothetical protein